MKHPIRYRLEWLGLLCLSGLARVVPARISHWAGSTFGRIVGVTWHARRRIARANIERAFPGWRTGAIDDLSSAAFSHLGQNVFEILRIGRKTPAWLLANVDSDNPLPFADLAQLGKGALLVSGHLGNWELFGGWIRALGFPVDFVVKPMRNPLTDAIYNRRRSDMDVGIIQTQVATRGIIHSLRQKRFVAILGDQYAGDDGIEVQFFGRMVSTPRGPAVLALRFGCPIVTGAMFRKPDGRFHAIVDQPIEYSPTGNAEEDIRKLTQLYTSRLEDHIRSQPEQWLWTHRRWRD